LFESAVIGDIRKDCAVPDPGQNGEALALICAADFKELNPGIPVQLQEGAVNELYHSASVPLCSQYIQGFNGEVTGGAHVTCAVPAYRCRSLQQSDPGKRGTISIKRLAVIGGLCSCKQ